MPSKSGRNILECYIRNVKRPTCAKLVLLCKLSCSRRSISEINSSKRFESCPSATSTQSRIQRSRFSASILPSAVRWQRHRANFLERLLKHLLIQNQGRTLFAKFVGRRTLQRIFACEQLFVTFVTSGFAAHIGIIPQQY